MKTDTKQTKEEQMECMRQRIVNQRKEINCLLKANADTAQLWRKAYLDASLFRDKATYENLDLQRLLRQNNIPIPQPEEEQNQIDKPCFVNTDGSPMRKDDYLKLDKVTEGP